MVTTCNNIFLLFPPLCLLYFLYHSLCFSAPDPPLYLPLKVRFVPSLRLQYSPTSICPGVTEGAWWLTRGLPLTSCWVLALAIWCDFWGATIIWDISSLMWYPHTLGLHGISEVAHKPPFSLKPWLGRAPRFSLTAAGGSLSNIYHWEVDP